MGSALFNGNIIISTILFSEIELALAVILKVSTFSGIK